ncbi:MAG: hypothetical protein JW873_07305 [Candidatus Saganbacteria bacterium]|nr:hypothetical protein [Candidatus Saganbacteria bacterium]
MQTYLLNGLIFCAILLLIALTVGAVQLIFILVDVRRTVRVLLEKVRVVTSLFDVAVSLVGARGSAFVAALKKLLNILFK